ncbi:hypothetical protein TrCOL_g150 [Triparma columacea]|uniref:non-specific serine/threonine protein kinase n=1 Tax=Triparma columacea TaxID=722753 RepID=A0A9W7GBE7_9STRA|nr:hypothetical protein TrCOL_g150 [Triparma columacea]
MGNCTTKYDEDGRPIRKERVLPASKAQQRKSEIHEQHKVQHLNQNIVHEEVKRRVTDVYDVNGAELGTGISGTVRVCTHKETKIQYALKTLDLHQIRNDEDAMRQLKDEIKILKALDHPNITRLEEVYETADHMYLILELCTGGEMLDSLNSQDGFHYTERHACDYVKTMVNAIRYIHDHNITHRDLKLENFLLQDNTDKADLKLIDFGLSRHFRPNMKLTVPVGTPYYVAPEVLRGTYNEKCDMWSLGVITYMLLSGTPPFPGAGEGEILQRVKRGHYSLDINRFDGVSEHAKDFIRKLLCMDATERMDAKQAQEHPWMHDWEDEKKPLSLDIAKSLKEFHKYGAMKKLVCEVLAYTLIPEQIHDLREEFGKIDVDNTGEFTIEQFREALGNSAHLSAEEADGIFNDMDIEHDGKIHWHEFIAATLSKCEYDERNLKLAFDRLDHEHHGFITQEDLAEIIGADSSAEEVKAMFEEVDYKHQGKIYFAEFVQIMKKGADTAPLSERGGSDSGGGGADSGRKTSVAINRNDMVLKINEHAAKKTSNVATISE